MRRRLCFAAMLFMALLCVTFTVPDSSTATPRWGETFTGDDALDNWTTLRGGFAIDNGRLTATNRFESFIFHESDVAYGWWRFDIYYVKNDNHRRYTIFFLADGFASSGDPLNSYQIEYKETWYGGDVAKPHKYELQKVMNGIISYHGGFVEPLYGPHIIEMVHVDIVRTPQGHLYVWLNYTGDEPETGISFQTNETLHPGPCPTTCSYFGIRMRHNYTQWIDNIQVDNNPENGPPPPPPPLIGGSGLEIVLLVTPWAIGLCVVVGALVVWRRRQKKVEITPGEELEESA
ncbi:MAG: hypothetical protein ACFFBR_03835 [Promethearchaeota archaeon]